MNINLTYYGSASITNKVLIVIYKSSAPNVAVDHQEFDAPHTTPREVTFADLEPVTFIVNLYESSGWPTLGQLRHSFTYDPTFAGVEVRAPLFISMAAPFVGTNDYTDATLVGWTIESIERVPQGTQFFGEQVALHGDGDGFNLVVSGDIFANGEKFVLRFAPRITIATPIYNSAKVITGNRIIDSDTELTVADSGKLLLLQGSGSAFTVTLPEIALIDSFMPFFFRSKGGNHINVSIKGKNTDTIEGASEVVLGQSEVLSVVNDPGEWEVFGSNLKHLEGAIIDDYLMGYNSGSLSVDRLNTRFADGQLLDRNVYRRLFNAVQQMDTNSIVSEAAWADTSIDPSTGKAKNNKGKWTLGDGSTTFRCPLLYSTGYLMGVDGVTRLAGDFKNEIIGDHQHESNDYYGGSSNFGSGTTTRSLMGTFFGVLSGKAALVSGVYRNNLTPAGKNSPDNYGIYKSIII